MPPSTIQAYRSAMVTYHTAQEYIILGPSEREMLLLSHVQIPHPDATPALMQEPGSYFPPGLVYDDIAPAEKKSKVYPRTPYPRCAYAEDEDSDEDAEVRPHLSRVAANTSVCAFCEQHTVSGRGSVLTRACKLLQRLVHWKK